MSTYEIVSWNINGLNMPEKSNAILRELTLKSPNMLHTRDTLPGPRLPAILPFLLL